MTHAIHELFAGTGGASLGSHRAWPALLGSGVDPRSLAGMLRRRGLVVPGRIGVRP